MDNMLRRWIRENASNRELTSDNLAWPKITIVTPSYNQGDFLKETIRSVLLQNYPKLEYIVIDGGSSDNSIEIIKMYEKYLAYWISEPDKGQSDALNKGFEKATGEICGYLNSDDLLMPNALQKVAIAFQQQFCTWLVSKVLWGESTSTQKHWEFRVPRFEEFVVQQTFPQQGVFWKANVEKPYFNYEWKFIMDHDFFARLYFQYGQPYILNETTAFFRTHPCSKTALMEATLDAERAKLVQKNCQQVPPQRAKVIQRERKRNLMKREANVLLTEQSGMSQWEAIWKSIQLVARDPYPLRDRIFVSIAVKLIIRALLPSLAYRANNKLTKL